MADDTNVALEVLLAMMREGLLGPESPSLGRDDVQVVLQHVLGVSPGSDRSVVYSLRAQAWRDDHYDLSSTFLEAFVSLVAVWVPMHHMPLLASFENLTDCGPQGWRLRCSLPLLLQLFHASCGPALLESLSRAPTPFAMRASQLAWRGGVWDGPEILAPVLRRLEVFPETSATELAAMASCLMVELSAPERKWKPASWSKLVFTVEAEVWQFTLRCLSDHDVSRRVLGAVFFTSMTYFCRHHRRPHSQKSPFSQLAGRLRMLGREAFEGEMFERLFGEGTSVALMREGAGLFLIVEVLIESHHVRRLLRLTAEAPAEMASFAWTLAGEWVEFRKLRAWPEIAETADKFCHLPQCAKIVARFASVNNHSGREPMAWLEKWAPHSAAAAAGLEAARQVHQLARQAKADKLRKCGGKTSDIVLPGSQFVEALHHRKEVFMFRYNQHCRSESQCLTWPSKAEVQCIVSVDASNMGLNSLSPDVYGFPNLTTLYLANNNLREVPEPLLALKQLQVLHLSRNGLRYVTPRIVAALPNLTELQVAGNRLRYFPFGHIAKLSALKVLKLEDNPLRMLGIERSSDNNLAAFVERGRKAYLGHEAALTVWLIRLYGGNPLWDMTQKDVVKLIMGWILLSVGWVKCDACQHEAKIVCRLCKKSYFCSELCMRNKHPRQCTQTMIS